MCAHTFRVHTCFGINILFFYETCIYVGIRNSWYFGVLNLYEYISIFIYSIILEMFIHAYIKMAN